MAVESKKEWLAKLEVVEGEEGWFRCKICKLEFHPAMIKYPSSKKIKIKCPKGCSEAI